MDWIDRLAETLGEAPLTGVETERLLSVARDVAHRVERKITPLSTFLVGVAAGQRMAGGGSRDQALQAALDAALSILPEAPSEG